MSDRGILSDSWAKKSAFLTHLHDRLHHRGFARSKGSILLLVNHQLIAQATQTASVRPTISSRAFAATIADIIDEYRRSSAIIFRGKIDVVVSAVLEYGCLVTQPSN